jgi:hypothetical protein
MAKREPARSGRGYRGRGVATRPMVARFLVVGEGEKNEAFELWFLLQFIFFDSAVGRQDYIEKLEGLLGHEYDKHSPSLYAELESRQETAIANAARLLALYPRPNPHADNPSTTVHRLVQEPIFNGTPGWCYGRGCGFARIPNLAQLQPRARHASS